MRSLSVALIALGLALAGCGPRGSVTMEGGGAIAGDLATAPPARERVASSSAYATDERMSPPSSGPVEHLPPGASPVVPPTGAESASPPPLPPRVELSGSIPLMEGLVAAESPTAARDSGATERVTQTFETAADYAAVVEWYARALADGWERKSRPTLGTSMRITQFSRGAGSSSAAEVQIAEVSGRVRVTINEVRPL